MPEWKNFCRIKELKTISFPNAEKNLLDFQIRRMGLRLQGFHLFLLGGTGAGKSSFFNLLAGEPLVPESPVRPTSEKISVYLHRKFAGELAELDVDCYYHERTDFSRLVVWDFPDFDSYAQAHHELAVLFREYADQIFLILHPEKLHQQNCLDFLRQYPKIPIIRWITHSAEMSKEQQQELLLHCNKCQEDWQSEFFLIDLLKDREKAYQQIFDCLSRWKSGDIRRSKQETAEKLVLESATLLQPFLDKTVMEVCDIESRLADLLSKERQFFQNLNLKILELYERRIFAGVYQKMRHNLLFTDPAYFAELLDWWRERKKQESLVDNFPLSLPCLLWEETFGGILEIDRENFLLNHHKIITEVQNILLLKSSHRNFWRSTSSILIDYISVLGVGWYIFQHGSFLAGVSGLLTQLFLLLCYIFFVALFFLLRLRKYEKKLFFLGLDVYQGLVLKSFQQQLEHRKKELHDSLTDLKHDVEIINKICR